LQSIQKPTRVLYLSNPAVHNDSRKKEYGCPIFRHSRVSLTGRNLKASISWTVLSHSDLWCKHLGYDVRIWINCLDQVVLAFENHCHSRIQQKKN